MSSVSKLLSHDDWDRAYPVIHSLRENLDRDSFLQSRDQMISKGYELFGLEDQGQIVSVVGLMIYPHLVRGLDCWVYDLATLESARSKGFGQQLLKFVERYAKERGCPQVNVHTKLHRTDAQRFYEDRAQWEKSAYVYKKTL